MQAFLFASSCAIILSSLRKIKRYVNKVLLDKDLLPFREKQVKQAHTSLLFMCLQYNFFLMSTYFQDPYLASGTVDIFNNKQQQRRSKPVDGIMVEWRNNKNKTFFCRQHLLPSCLSRQLLWRITGISWRRKIAHWKEIKPRIQTWNIFLFALQSASWARQRELWIRTVSLLRYLWRISVYSTEKRVSGWGFLLHWILYRRHHPKLYWMVQSRTVIW